MSIATAAVPTRFPSTYQALTTAELLAAYARGAARVREAIAGLAPAELRARPIPGKWSIQEIVAHLTDSELMGAVRVRLTYAQDRPSLVAYDQEVWTPALDHQGLDEAGLERTVRLFELLRETTLSVFARATADHWQRTAIHPEWGPLTLRNLLELYADHAERHIEQILERRTRLGKSLAMPLLLPVRLY